MIRRIARFVLILALFACFPNFTRAATLTNCTPAVCGIPENVLFELPFIAFAGDVIVLEPDSNQVSDVLRFFNNVIDTGGGTGLGNQGFLFSRDEGPLPASSTYSANAITIRESFTDATTFTGNGTIYVLGVPEPSTFGLLALGFAGMVFLSRQRPAKNSPAAVRRLAALVLLTCGVAGAQDVDLIEPLTTSSATYRNTMGRATTQPTFFATASTGLAFYTAGYNSLGTSLQLPMNIVGTNPADGAATTTIPTVIVPIKVVYQGTGLSLDGTNVVPAVQNSPIFQNADYTAGGTDLGVTQFGDALQRAQFWNLPGFSQDYHVLLGAPVVAPTVTVTVNSGSQGHLYQLSTGVLLGVVTASFFDDQLNALVPNYTANTLPIFLTDSVYEGDDGTINTCCTLGYHASEGPPASTARTWIFAAYTEPGTFRGNVVLDVQGLSHEVAEWLNDPFVGFFGGGVNIVPPAVLPGQGGACILNFESADPLEAPPVVFPKVTNGTTYQLQDSVFLPWYLHTTPSFSVNGWYTLQNTFKTFSNLCGPG